MQHDYFDDAVSYGNLRRGLRKACRGVRWKDSVVGYESNAVMNTVRLHDRITSGTYRISKYQVFEVYEPKRRTIMASRLVDRQFQRSLCDAGLYEDICEHFVRDSFACQVGRGTDDALNRLTYQLRKYYRHHGRDGWVLTCDIHHFFESVPHDVAKESVHRHVSDMMADMAVCDIIDSFGGDRGIGLGSQVSQLVMLSVLNPLDHMIRERLKVRCYVRYMDDFLMVHESREHLQECRTAIAAWLAERGFELNGKTSLQPLSHGVRFIKWRFVLTKTGKVLMLMDPRKVARQRRKTKRLYAKEQSGEVDEGTTRASMASWLANARRGNTFRMRRRMVRWYEQLTGDTYFTDEGRW